jgi:3-hydroxy-9,10-secoandrosta-1,3,5(10)-triene-9,17-dione monooxygenase
MTLQSDRWGAWADAEAITLAGRAMEAEALRRLPQKTVDEAAAAGFFRMVTPERWGGEGGDLRTLFDVSRRLAHGCASSAWTLSFLALHSWLLCRFHPRLQEELFAGGAIPMAPAPLAPTGRVEPAPGGYRLTGRWEWATGVMHADWVMVNAVEPGMPAPRFCVLPLSDVTVLDVWKTAGMCATGSNTVVVDDVFVPEYRTVEAWRIKLGQTVGETLHEGTSVTWPMSPVLALIAATPALGAAEAALEAFTARMREKLQAYSGAKVADLPMTHFRLGEGAATVRAARLIWEDAIATLERIGPLGAAAPVEDLVAIRLAAAHLVRLANEAVAALAGAAGASSGFLTSPLQRALRDLQMMRGHVVFDWDRSTQIAGRMALGIAPGPADLV